MLHDYTALIRKVRNNKVAGMNINEAVDCAVQECINENILREFLLKHREEATDMILTEYNEKEHLEHVANYNKEQVRRQGIKQGLAQGRREQNELDLNTLIKNLMKEDSSMPEDMARKRALQLLGMQRDH